MKCHFCNKEIDEGSSFCGYCGKEQPKVKHQEFEAVDEADEKRDSKKELVSTASPKELKVIEVEEVTEDKPMDEAIDSVCDETNESAEQDIGINDSELQLVNNSKKYFVFGIIILIGLLLLGYYLYFNYYPKMNYAIYESDVSSNIKIEERIVDNDSIITEYETTDIPIIDDVIDENPSLEVYVCIVDSIRGRYGAGLNYDENEDWWANIERGDEVYLLESRTNGFVKCVISGYRGSPCCIWIPTDCIEKTGKIETITWSLSTINECDECIE